MIKIINKSTIIKKSNFVYLIEKKSDLNGLDFLKFDNIILKKLQEIIKKDKSISMNFFLGKNNFETFTCLYYSKSDKNTLTEFLGCEIPKLSKNLTISANNDKNMSIMMDATLLSRYTFNHYKSDKQEEEEIFILVDKSQNLEAEERLKTIYNIFLARDLGETPACDLTPENFSILVKKTKWKNTKVKIITPKNIIKKGLGLIHGVGKGSANKPYMVILERIVDKNAPTYGFVGKGIVFDSGGLDIKTNMMYEMKDDMCGAGTVFATMKELDEKDIKVNIIGCLCLAENFVSSESYRPSDILTSYSGKTVNITNTDAEGRLVLADGVSYIGKNYKTDHMITVATLTGVALFALGHRYAGIMGTDRKIIDTLVDKSKTDFEKYNELPFDNYYIDKCKSNIADFDNWTGGIYTGSTMGGAFIYNFLQNNEKFTHLDIAGVANNQYEPYGLYPKGSTGFGVDSLSKLFLGL